MKYEITFYWARVRVSARLIVLKLQCTTKLNTATTTKTTVISPEHNWNHYENSYHARERARDRAHPFHRSTCSSSHEYLFTALRLFVTLRGKLLSTPATKWDIKSSETSWENANCILICVCFQQKTKRIIFIQRERERNRNRIVLCCFKSRRNLFTAGVLGVRRKVKRRLLCLLINLSREEDEEVEEDGSFYFQINHTSRLKHWKRRLWHVCFNNGAKSIAIT